MKQLLLVFTLLVTFLIPQEFAAAASPPSQLIIVNTAINKLAFYENGNLVREFPVATGKSSTPTPQGKFLIVNKIKNRPYYTGGIPGGDPRNPLGDRWLGMNIYGTPGNTYAIHGNNNESSIGKWVSSGCVRMHNDDIRWLYDRINVNATVIIKWAQASYQEIAALYGISLTDKSSKGVLDSPVSGAVLSGSYNVSGWFLDGSGVSKVEVLVDGAVVGWASYGDARPDVQNAYPEYQNGNAGYHYALDTMRLRNGNHRITVRETGNNGQVTTLPERTVKISNVRGVLDNPVSGATLTGSYNVSGWFLDESGVSKVEILIDGAVAGQASYGDARPDVQNAYPEYKNGNAGYHYTLDTTRFNDGNHRITVRETGKNGQVTTLPEGTVTISNVRGVLDNPVSGTVLSGSYNVSGWFLDGSGVSKVEVLVDGVVAGQASYGDARPDVQNAYPEYKNGNAGYHYALDTTKISNGSHRITVRETGKNGKVMTLPERTVKISNVKSPLAAPVVNPVNDQDQTVIGAAEAGATVRIKAGSKTYEGTAKADGTFTVAIDAQKAGSVLKATATDKAGNVSPITKITVSATDTTPPAAPVVNPVNDQDQTVTGAAEAGATVRIKAGSKTYEGTAKADGTFTVAIDAQKAGSVLKATATDKAGNVSPITKITVSATDTTPPAAPVVNPVNDQDQTVTGAAEAGATVRIKAGSKTYEGTAKADGTFTVAIDAQKAGSVLKATATDKAGNVSPITKITVSATDTTPPAAPVVNPVNDQDQTVTGAAEAGATVRVKAGSKTYEGTAKADGTFTVAIDVQKAGSVLKVTATDKARNISTTTKITAGS